MKKLLPIIFLSLLLGSCASTTQYVKFSGNETNNESNAKIYVLRPSSYGSGIKMNVYQDEKLIGKLGPKSYLSWEVDPSKGDITVISKSENKDMLTISPNAGKTYYIKQKVKMGWVVARSGLEFIDTTEAMEILRKLKKPKMKYAE